MWQNYQVFALTPGVKLMFALLVIWSIVWKGIALWKAARNYPHGMVCDYVDC